MSSAGNEKISSESLLAAVNSNDAAAVQQALQNGANLNVCVRNRQNGVTSTPLLDACKHGYDEIARILLDAGANARFQTHTNNGWFVILEACQAGHLSIVEMLLNHDNGLLELGDYYGETPLSVAIKYQQVDIVRFLLDRGATCHAAPIGGPTALMYACEKGNLAIVRLLLAADVDVEARDGNQRTALHHSVFLAMEHGSIEVMRELILQHNANMFAVDGYGKTPFNWICQREGNPVVDQFLDLYYNKMRQDHGRLALHAILGTAEYTVVENEDFHPPLKPLLQIRLSLGTLTFNEFRSLLSTLDNDLIRNRDESGKLPLHLACRNSAPVEVLSMLVEIGVATLHMADHDGALPIHECCSGVVDDTSVIFLMEQGGVGSLAARTREGALPLHTVCGSTNPSWRTVQYMIRSFPGAVSARTNAGLYPFVIAACESSTASLSVVYDLVRTNPGVVLPNHLS